MSDLLKKIKVQYKMYRYLTEDQDRALSIPAGFRNSPLVFDSIDQGDLFAMAADNEELYELRFGYFFTPIRTVVTLKPNEAEDIPSKPDGRPDPEGGQDNDFGRKPEWVK